MAIAKMLTGCVLVDEFFGDRKKLSARTEPAYRQDLAHWVEFLKTRDKSNGLDVASLLTTAVSADAAQFVARNSQGEDCWHLRTLARKIAVLRVFYRWVASKGRLSAGSPFAGIRVPKPPSKNPEPATAHEIEKLRTVVRQDTSLTGLRTSVMIELFLSLGVTHSVLLKLKIGHVLTQVDRPYFYDRLDVPRGAETRRIELPAEAAVALSNYIAARAKVAAASQTALFVNKTGREIDPRSIRRHFEFAAKRAGLRPRICFYNLRLVRAQQLLQHASVAEVHRVTGLSIGCLSTLKRAISNSRPQAKAS